MSLSDLEIERYSRQIVLPEIGGRGQEVLLGCTAAVLGAGEPASTVASYLAGAGVGRIDLFPDRSRPAEAVEEIRRQVLGLNPEVRAEVRSLPVGLSAGAWTTDYDAVVSAGDSATLRAAIDERGVLIAGGVTGSCGWLWVGRGNQPGDPCAACAEHEALAESSLCSDPPLAPAAAGVIGSLLSLATLKLLLGIGVEPGGWWFYDGRTESLTLRREARDECPACGDRRAERA